jgi:glycosyltransferase involved in cell wall biosynthesis
LSWQIPSSFGPPSSQLTPILYALCRRAAEISEAIRFDDVGVLIGCTGTPIDVPATAIAAQNLGLPFVAYLFDDPVYQWPAGPYRDFSAWQEMSWSGHAATVLAPNEFMAEEFKRRTGRLARVVRNPVNLASYLNAEPGPASDNTTKRIVYTGSIYHAQLDAFRNLVDAIGTKGAYEIHIYTSQAEAVLDAHGINRKAVIHHPFIDSRLIPHIQKKADILFLPLAFGTDTQEVLRTSAPAKLGEYLAAGRPILVHAPRDSFVVHHIRSNNAGLVVDQPDPTALRATLDRLSTDPQLQRTLIENAIRLSHDYDLAHVRNLFWSTIEEISIGSSDRTREEPSVVGSNTGS